MKNSPNNIFNAYPDIVNGYELSPNRGMFSVIIPEATTNIITNPSVEVDTTGYTAVGGSIAQTYDWQAYGAAGLEITPAAVTESGFYFGAFALSVNEPYTASIVFQGEHGRLYYLWFGTTGGALVGTKQAFRATGHKQRVFITYNELTGASRRIYLTRDAAYNDTNFFYADGLQVENKAYPTTFCDGSLKGFLPNEILPPYYWVGEANASASVRTVQTRTGGREVNLLDLGLRVLAVIGLGMANVVDQSLPIPGLGSLPQGTGTTARDFTIIGGLEGGANKNQRYLQSIRNSLVDAFKPDLTTDNQELILRYQSFDDDDNPISESLDIVCKYQYGLEGNWDNNQREKVALQFRMYLPFIQKTYASGIELGYQTTITGVGNIAQRSSDGVWSDMDGGLPLYGILPGYVQTIVVNPITGEVYAGGYFDNASGGGATYRYIVKWNGTAWSPVIASFSGEVIVLAFDAAGNLYIGGAFNNQGDINGDNIIMWDGSAASSLDVGLNGAVYAIAIDPSTGYIYIGGAFTDAGGVAGADYLTMWDGTSFNSVVDNLNDVVTALMFDNSGVLYVGGDFTDAGGVAKADYIFKYIGVSVSALVSGTGITGTIRAIEKDNLGNIYIGGAFTYLPQETMRYLIRYDGANYHLVGDDLDGDVYRLFYYKGLLYIGGAFTHAGEYELPDRAAVWNGSIYLPLDINYSSSAYITAIDINKRTGALYIGGSGFSTTATSATVITPEIEGSKTYPIIYITGPGKIWQIKNYRTNKSIFFDDLTLLAGEKLVLDFNPLNNSFTSSFRGNISGKILPGSNLIFELAPGENPISAYLFGSTTAATKIYMVWRDQEWASDGAVIE